MWIPHLMGPESAQVAPPIKIQIHPVVLDNPLDKPLKSNMKQIFFFYRKTVTTL